MTDLELYLWYYIPGSPKQHVVRKAQLTDFPWQTAICGRQVLAALPAAVRWQKDPEGLEAREKCRSCTAAVEKLLEERGSRQ